MRRKGAPVALLVLALAAGAAPLAAQPPPASAPAETLRVAAGSPEAPAIALAGGERVAVWTDSDVRLAAPEAGPPPVAEGAPGELIARFAGSGAFAWPREPVVWTAPRTGRLVFGLNTWPAHGARGEARVLVVRLGAAGRPPPAGFATPWVELARVPGGVVVRYRDGAGFGLDRKSLRLTLTTAHGTRVRLAPWAEPAAAETTLPLPPPGVPLPSGIHTLSATIADRLGNEAPPATITFDAPATP